jgi:hypothetical protein
MTTSSGDMERIFQCPKCQGHYPFESFMSANCNKFTVFCETCRTEQHASKRKRESGLDGIRSGCWDDFLEYLAELYTIIPDITSLELNFVEVKVKKTLIHSSLLSKFQQPRSKFRIAVITPFSINLCKQQLKKPWAFDG